MFTVGNVFTLTNTLVPGQVYSITAATQVAVLCAESYYYYALIRSQKFTHPYTSVMITYAQGRRYYVEREGEGAQCTCVIL